MLFAVRKYRPEDFPILFHIDQSCFAPGISYTKLELKTYIQRREAFTLVAEAQPENSSTPTESAAEKAVLGFIVSERSRGAGHIITIDVRKEARRLKVGSVLLNSAEQQLREQACALVRLETAVDNVGALSFYKRRGYSVVKTIPRYYSNGVDALLLEKDLLSPPPTS